MRGAVPAVGGSCCLSDKVSRWGDGRRSERGARCLKELYREGIQGCQIDHHEQLFAFGARLEYKIPREKKPGGKFPAWR